jgi:hypothetical protein
MPFPTAHPAAVLPLRRYCPRLFNFPALVTGSLVPDLGYLFAGVHPYLAYVSHTFKGSFVFCLPAGLAVVGLFYALRRPALGILPPKQRQLWLAACRGPGSLVSMVFSLLVGAWGHLVLDLFTHGTPWTVEWFPWLRLELYARGSLTLRVSQVLWLLATFAGTMWVAAASLKWLGKTTGSAQLKSAGAARYYPLLLSALVFPCAVAHQILPAMLERSLACAVAVALVAALGLLLARRKLFGRA